MKQRLLLLLMCASLGAFGQNTNGTLQRQIASPNALTGVFGAIRDSMYTRAQVRALVPAAFKTGLGVYKSQDTLKYNLSNAAFNQYIPSYSSGTKKVYYAFGDSFTIGGSPFSTTPYPVLVAAWMNFSLTNKGISGSSMQNQAPKGTPSANMTQRLAEILSYDSSRDGLLSFLYYANDFFGKGDTTNYTMDHYKMAWDTVLNNAINVKKWPPGQILVYGATWITQTGINTYAPNPTFNRMSRMQDALRYQATKWGVNYVDLAESMKMNGDSTVVLNSDGVHPTNAGHQVIAKQAYKSLVGHYPEIVSVENLIISRQDGANTLNTAGFRISDNNGVKFFQEQLNTAIERVLYYKSNAIGKVDSLGNITATAFKKPSGTSSQFLKADGSSDATVYGTGNVSTVSVVPANGISGSVATSTTTPAITLTLGAITPTTVNASTSVQAVNMGIGVTPVVSAGSNVRGLGMGNYTWTGNNASTGGSSFANNAVASLGNSELTGWAYLNTDMASRVWLDNGSYKVQTAPSGTVGTAITWTDRMTISNVGAASIPNLVSTTQSPNDNSTKVATTAYVDNAVSSGGGKLDLAISQVNSNYTIGSNDYTVQVISNVVTITLPATGAGTNGRIVVIKKQNANANDVTVDGDGSDTIDGSATYTLNNAYESVTLQANGSVWAVIATVNP